MKPLSPADSTNPPRIIQSGEEKNTDTNSPTAPPLTSIIDRWKKSDQPSSRASSRKTLVFAQRPIATNRPFSLPFSPIREEAIEPSEVSNPENLENCARGPSAELVENRAPTPKPLCEVVDIKQFEYFSDIYGQKEAWEEMMALIRPFFQEKQTARDEISMGPKADSDAAITLPSSNESYLQASPSSILGLEGTTTLQIRELIKVQCPNAKPRSLRVLNILNCAAGGQNFFPQIPHPESKVFAKALRELPNDQRLTYLRVLTNNLQIHLSKKQKRVVSEILESLARSDTDMLNGRLRNAGKELWSHVVDASHSLSDFAPGSGEELAIIIKSLIGHVKDDNMNGTVRALQIFYCVAGGRILFKPTQPETIAVFQGVGGLASVDRYEYLQHLYEKLNSYLTPFNTVIEPRLRELEITIAKGDPDPPKSIYFGLRQALHEKLEDLNVKTPAPFYF